MFLSKIDDFFSKILSAFGEDFNIGTFIVLITGILLGIIISVCTYLVIFIKSLKNDKIGDISLKDIEGLKDQTILLKRIDEIKEDFLIDSEGLSMKEKMGVFGNSVYTVVNTVASYYYPESKYPIYEVSVDELIKMVVEI